MNKDTAFYSRAFFRTHFLSIYRLQEADDLLKQSESEFDVFKHFGFQSGRDVDKFADYKDFARSENGLVYLTKGVNSFISADVTKEIDLGSHTMFIAEATDGEILSEENSMTYAYYHRHIKPKPEKPKKEQKGYRCIVCGYVYEGEDLPDDFICPWCKHGVVDFEKIK